MLGRVVERDLGPQDPSLHQGLCFWLKQNNLLSLQVFSHLGSVPG